MAMLAVGAHWEELTAEQRQAVLNPARVHHRPVVFGHRLPLGGEERCRRRSIRLAAIAGSSGLTSRSRWW